MKYVYAFIWAAICAWVIVWLIGYLDAKYGFLDTLFFPAIINFIHGFGISAKTVLFVVLTFLLWGTEWYKYIGRGLFNLIGLVVLLLFIGLIILGGYWFLNWMSGLL